MLRLTAIVVVITSRHVARDDKDSLRVPIDRCEDRHLQVRLVNNGAPRDSVRSRRRGMVLPSMRLPKASIARRSAWIRHRSVRDWEEPQCMTSSAWRHARGLEHRSCPMRSDIVAPTWRYQRGPVPRLIWHMVTPARISMVANHRSSWGLPISTDASRTALR